MKLHRTQLGRVGLLTALGAGAALAVGLVSAGAQVDAGARDFVKAKPAEIRWTGTPGGMQTAILEGNPTRPGIYVMRVKFPPGSMTRPHTHSQDRFVTVISGTWHAGIGEKFEPDKTDPMPAGSFMKHPSGAAHFDGAKDEEAIVQIIGMGPVTTRYLEGADGKSK